MNTFFSNPSAYQADHQMFASIYPSAEPRCFLERIRAFFYTSRTPEPPLSSENLLSGSATNISSISTPNGPWVYTVVPWED